MNAIKRFWNSSLAVTMLMGCLSLFLLVSLCGILAIINRPLALVPTANEIVPKRNPAKTIQATETATGISPTPTLWILPTNTLPPTKRVGTIPSFSVTESIVSTPSAVQAHAKSITSCVTGSAQTGKVLEVIDGDTIRVLLDGLVVKVKYIGIDAPESVSRLEHLGKEAKMRNRELVSGRDVLLYKDTSDKDRFDRLLRYVLVDDRFINYDLVNLGYASALDEPPDSSCAILFKQAAANAKEHSLGIWAPHTPQPVLSLAAGSLLIYSVNKEAEFIDLQNISEMPIDLNGWRLVSEQGNQECKLEGTIQAYEIMRIFSGIKQPGFSCGFDKAIWNDNEPDPAVLYNPEGIEVDRYP